MARYGTWEREQELMALEREDREVFDDEPSGGHQAELARMAQQDIDMFNAGEEREYVRDSAFHDDLDAWIAQTTPPCDHDDHAPEDCLPLPF